MPSTRNKHLPKPSHLFIIITLIFWSFFFTAFWSQGHFLKNGDLYAKSLGTWADGAAHLTYISAMAYQPTFPRYLPILYQQPFLYPFVADYLSALLVKAGASLFAAYNSLGLVLSLILIYLLYRFYYRLTCHHLASAISLNLFLFSGGLGFYYFLQDLYQQGLGLLTHIPKEYTILGDYHIRWLNIVTGELIPQRAFLLGLVVSLPILLVALRFLRQPKSTPPLHLFLAAILYGHLPLIHPHSFINLTLVLFYYFLILLPKNRSIFFRSLTFLIPALLIATPLFFSRLLPHASQSFIRWYPGWLATTENTNWLWFWIINWGLFLPSAIIGYFFLSPFTRRFLYPFFFIFIISNLVLFQPYDWDNSKLLTWVYLALAPAAATLILRLYSKSSLRITSIILFLLLTATGAIDVIRQLQPSTSVRMYTAEQLTLAKYLRQHTPPDSLFITSTHHVHLVPTLTGRQILMGYPGWLWTYGLDYSNYSSLLHQIYAGGDSARYLLDQLSADYLVIGPSEQNDYHPHTPFFKATYPVLIATKNYTIYQLKSPSQ